MNNRIEKLDDRMLLAGDVLDAINVAEQHLAAAEIAAQYEVNHPPRLQPGNVPLVGTPAYDGLDRIDIVWQTVRGGDGEQDSFRVEYRMVGEEVWSLDATINDVIDTESGSRLMHSATIIELDWDTEYEYRVHHLRGDEVVETYSNKFHTRLESGDAKAFSFAAYGDSSRGGNNRKDFNSVQQRINELNLDFSVLLGDNIYTFGTHGEADNRFRPDLSPEAVEWTSSKVDYFAVGNHDIFVDNGRPSRDLYSVPIQVDGVNAPVGVPEGEFPEHSYSFDYGDVHFVTFDTNLVDLIEPDQRELRLNRLMDYVVADLAASNAKWKIVYGHHPFIGTEKRQLPSDVYFQEIVSRLGETDADLLMLAHSHSYSWTYPITGFSDADSDGNVEYDEVEFVQDDDQSYQKGDGLIQLVAGAGGGSLRHTTYDEALFAKGFSRHESTGPLEYGFAQVDVNPQGLTVSYISAETGEIVGDTNANGRMDPGEDFFGQFKIVDSSVANPDVNSDGAIDDLDLDAMFRAVRVGSDDLKFDLNSDGAVDQSDAVYLQRDVLGIRPGDANLDGRFDSRDFVTVFRSAGYEDDEENNSGWAEGDWNGDGDFTTFDLVVAFREGGYVAAGSPINPMLNAVGNAGENERDGGLPEAEVAILELPNALDNDTSDLVFVEIQAVNESPEEKSPLDKPGCGICGTACFMNCATCSKPLKSAEYRPGD